MGLTENLEACDFYASDVWFRGIADLVILDDEVATVVDYKTGKSSKYADKGQLELMALALMARYPQIKKVRAALLSPSCGRSGSVSTGRWKPQQKKTCGTHDLTDCVSDTVLLLNVSITEPTDALQKSQRSPKTKEQTCRQQSL
jgi:hypothetical protein